jgi:hypothetical protein
MECPKMVKRRHLLKKAPTGLSPVENLQSLSIATNARILPSPLIATHSIEHFTSPVEKEVSTGDYHRLTKSK